MQFRLHALHLHACIKFDQSENNSYARDFITDKKKIIIKQTKSNKFNLKKIEIVFLIRVRTNKLKIA